MIFRVLKNYFSCSSLHVAVETMQHSDLKRLVAKYKFSIVAENAICDDYVTEKLWRTLEVGSVPIIIGSPKIRVRIMNHILKSIKFIIFYVKSFKCYVFFVCVFLGHSSRPKFSNSCIRFQQN